MERTTKDRNVDLLDKYLEGSTSLQEEEELRERLAGRDDAQEIDEAAAVMFELFAQERKVHYPGTVMPLRRRRKTHFLLATAAAAIVAVFVVLTATVWKPERPVVYCFVNGEPVTDYQQAVEQREMALGIISESFEKTAAMFQPLDEVGRAVKELEKLGLFDMNGANAKAPADNL